MSGMATGTFNRSSGRLVWGLVPVVALAISACAGSPPARAAKPTGHLIRVLGTGACPTSLGSAHDVRNFGSWPAMELAPPGPVGGLICRYAAPFTQPTVAPPTLYRQVRLTETEAATLGVAVDELSTAHPTGSTSCPAAFDTASVIVLFYRTGQAADLWFSDTGCQTLDNGSLSAFEPGDPAFYLRFDSLIDSLAAPRPGPGG